MKKKRRLYKMFTKWCLSYLVISLVALTVIIFCSARYSQVLAEELEYVNAVQLESTQMQIDQRVRNLRAFSNRAMLNRMVDSLRQLDSWESVSRYDLYKLVRDMQEESLSNEGQEDCYLYFPRSDLMVSGNYYNNSREYFDIVFKEYGIRYEDWYPVINGNYLTSQIFSLKQDNGEFLTVMVRPLDSSSRKIPPANAIMIMEMKEILKSTSWLELDRDQICVVDLTNQRLVLNSPLDEDVGEELLSYAMENRQTEFKSMVEMGTSVVSFVRSQYENWDYVVITKEQPFVLQIQNLQQLVVGLMLLYLMVSAVVIGYSGLRYYYPIRDVLSALQQGGNSDKLELADKDVYAYITKAVSSLVDQNRENQDVIKRQRDAISRAMGHRLLLEKDAYSLMEEELEEKYGLPMEGFSFRILAYQLDRQPPADGESDLADTQKISAFILQNVTEENLEQEELSWICFHEGENELIFLVWFSQEIEGVWKKMESACERTTAFVRGHFKFPFQTALSEVHSGGEEIAQAYEEALRVFEYQKKGKNILTYGEIDLLPEDTLLKYPRAAENRLVHWIQNGNAQEACGEIEQLLKENEANCLDPEAMQFFAGSIATSIIRAAEKVAKEASLYTAQKQLLNSCRQGDTGKMQEKLEQMVKDACARMTEYNQQEKDDLKGRIYIRAKTYIEENYSDPELNVNAMAAYLGVQPAYLSKLFKEIEGEKLSQYISKVRLRYVKKLLLENERLEEISVRCGFGSQRTFLRIFKQYEGLTPTQFKELEEKKGKEGME